MQAVCVTAFRDMEAGVLRGVGDVFDVTQERLDAINGTKYGKLAEEVAEAPRATARRGRKAKTEE